MANQVRNSRFVARCKELCRDGFTMNQIAAELAKEFKRPTLSRRTVFNAIHFGINSV